MPVTELIDYEEFCGIRGEETLPQEVEEGEEFEVKDASVSVYGFGGDIDWRLSKC